MRSILLHLILLLAFVVSGCSSSLRLHQDSLVKRLNNRGPVALSADNPFLAANLLLSREMEQSSEIKGFVKHRGAPAALELSSETFGSLQMNLYYPETREYFNFEELSDSWLITGPFRIPADKMKQVAVLTRGVSGEPKLAVSQKEQAPPAPQLPETSAQDGNGAAAAINANSTAAPMTLQEIIDSSPKLSAELSPKGDLVHYVTWSGETLSLLARWYTGDRENAARIARINQLSKPNELSIGDTIIIPSYLLKNKIRLSKQALDQMQRLVARDLQ